MPAILHEPLSHTDRGCYGSNAYEVAITPIGGCWDDARLPKCNTKVQCPAANSHGLLGCDSAQNCPELNKAIEASTAERTCLIDAAHGVGLLHAMVTIDWTEPDTSDYSLTHKPPVTAMGRDAWGNCIDLSVRRTE